jgi:hypothetical protein
MSRRTSHRTAAVINELWKYVLHNEPNAATFGIVEGVLNRQLTETRALAGTARNIAEHFGMEVQS